MTGDGQGVPTVYRFGSFELLTGPGELRKHGTRIKLQDQPLQILVLLLEHAGGLVTRERIQNKLWPPGTYVDYDNAINSAVRKLREALGDDSGDPRFIETSARRGYRFIGAIEAPPRLDQPPPTRAPPGLRKGLVAGACGVILVLAIAVADRWLLKPRPVTKAVPINPVPLTAAPGWEAFPSLSPDGNQVAYSWQGRRDAVSHIYVKLIGEGKPVQLTSGPASDSSPAWSADGRMIAFLRNLNGTTGIYTIPALGGAERKVTQGQFTYYVEGSNEGMIDDRVTWSPDGRFLAVSERQAQKDSSSLSLISVENGDRLVLTKPPNAQTWDADPVFSPDGRLLLFTRHTGAYHGGLYLLDLAAGYRPTGDPRLLETGNIDGATWTANGSEIIYAAADDFGEDEHLMRIPARAGSQPDRLTVTGDQAWPAIAQRGNRLVYVENLDDVDIWQVQPGKPQSSFASSTSGEDSPQYSPDGKRVAFSSNRSGSQQVWVCDGDGGTPVQLTRFDRGPSGTPRWSPDGRWIAFDHQTEQGWQIYVMAADGGQSRRLTQDEGDSVIPSWSGDGRWIYYSNNQGERYEIWKRASRGGQAIQVTRNGGWIAFESIDRESLYYEKYLSHGLWMLPLRGGEEKKVLESVARRNFAVVDDGIYYMPDPAADGSTTVRFRSFRTAQDKEIARVRDVYQGLAVSPDRKTILFSAYSRSGTNVMVVDHFR
jgi:Tol biopolymer transport system component/DNA-binding winged helix-turn-helix (wHTH) protein